MPAAVLFDLGGRERQVTAVMIGIDPHKASHTAVAIDQAERPLGEVRVRASAGQAQRLVAWAADWPDKVWAVEGARGLGLQLAQQLLAAGERVLDVQPKLGARVRVLATGATGKNDPNDARSVAVAPACLWPTLGQGRSVDHVGLNLRLSDRPGLRPVGHHPPRPAGQHRGNRPGVPGRLQRHLRAPGQ